MSYFNDQGNIQCVNEEKKRNTKLVCFGFRPVLVKTINGVFELLLIKTV